MSEDIEIRIRNYRCFGDDHPQTLHLRNGFTALLGKNNSGKSSLLRLAFELRNAFVSFEDMNFFRAARAARYGFGLPSTVPDALSIATDNSDRDVVVEIVMADGTRVPQQLAQRVRLTISRGSTSTKIDLFKPNGEVQPFAEAHANIDGLLTFSDGWSFDFGRWVDACRVLQRTFYIGAYRNTINVGSNEAYFDISVGQAFIKQWKRQQTGSVKSHRDAAYELTKRIGRIFEFDSLEIQASDDEKSLRVVVNGRSLDISEVGAGMTQFVMALANLAVRETSYVLIDEPELNLHASLQMDFLTTLASFANDGVVFATHNHGLARSSANWIYGVSKTEEGKATIRPLEEVPSLSAFLGSLSFSQYPDLGFDRILLAEGPQDCLVFQQWLRQYGKEHRVMILPLGGGSLINGSAATEAQLREVLRITNRVTALIDSEKAHADEELGADRKAFKVLCESLNIDCHVTKRRATENYFTDAAVKKGFGGSHDALGEYDSLKSAGAKGWRKSMNWRAARYMTKDDLGTTDIGGILAAL